MGERIFRISNEIVPFNFQEVEPMYRESDHMHAIALGSALKVGIRVVYLDRGGITTSPPEHDFPEDWTPSVYLLYRPGHYDILYK